MSKPINETLSEPFNTISQTETVNKNESEIKLRLTCRRGDLPVMLFWQSLDGRPVFEYHHTVYHALDRAKCLTKLGLKPRVFLNLDGLTFV
jgi:hypothetical protein